MDNITVNTEEFKTLLHRNEMCGISQYLVIMIVIFIISIIALRTYWKKDHVKRGEYVYSETIRYLTLSLAIILNVVSIIFYIYSMYKVYTTDLFANFLKQ